MFLTDKSQIILWFNGRA